MRKLFLGVSPILLVALVAVLDCGAQPSVSRPSPHEGVYMTADFHYKSGETSSALRLHYLTLGQPVRDSAGRVTNAVLILHGTAGSGRQFLAPQFADALFGPGQLLDTS